MKNNAKFFNMCNLFDSRFEDRYNEKYQCRFGFSGGEIEIQKAKSFVAAILCASMIMPNCAWAGED